MVTSATRPTRTVSVLVVDDHVLVRTCVKAILTQSPSLTVVGEAGNGEETLRLVRELRPNVVIMDLLMPGLSSMEVIHRLSKVHPEVKIVVLTATLSTAFPKRLLDLGVKGYLTKNSTADELVDAVLSAARGKLYLAKEVAQELALSNIDSKRASPMDALSNREFQIMTMLVSGYRVEYIADKLSLSPKTVSSHRYAVLEKLNVKSDVDLTHLAVNQGLLDISLPADADAVERAGAPGEEDK